MLVPNSLPLVPQSDVLKKKKRVDLYIPLDISHALFLRQNCVLKLRKLFLSFIELRQCYLS